MQAPGPQNSYAVYCFQCKVTAPVGTRQCIHCGGRLSGEQDPRRATLAALLGAEIADAGEHAAETPASIGSVVPKLAIWILLLVGGFLYRFCE